MEAVARGAGANTILGEYGLVRESIARKADKNKVEREWRLSLWLGAQRAFRFQSFSQVDTSPSFSEKRSRLRLQLYRLSRWHGFRSRDLTSGGVSTAGTSGS